MPKNIDIQIRNHKIILCGIQGDVELTFSEGKDLSQQLLNAIQQEEEHRKRTQILSYVQDLFCTIPKGGFVMGESHDDPYSFPERFISIENDFLKSKVPISQEFYQGLCGSNPAKFKGVELAVDSVSWYDAIVFANLLSTFCDLEPCYQMTKDGVHWNREAKGYRLPTEAEWEYACFANQDTLYAGSDNFSDVAQPNSTMPPKLSCKKPNAFGLYDMSGLIFTWCFDSWHEELGG